VETPSGLKFIVVNVYNAGTGSARTGEAAAALIECEHRLPLVAAGDFNLHHEDWEEITPTTRVLPQGQALVDWAARKNIALVRRYGEQTHTLGGVLDLVWASSTLVASPGLTARVAQDISVPSDHSVLRITLHGGIGARYGCPGRFKMDSVDKTLFANAIRAAMPTLQADLASCSITAMQSNTQHANLDHLSESLTETLQTALELSAKRSSGKALGY
jgi:hypothetical protein